MKTILLGIAASILLAIGSAVVLENFQQSATDRYTAAGSVRL